MKRLPEPSCPSGYTAEDLEAILGPRIEAFWHWMRGQTMMVCEGKKYHYVREHNTMCPHLSGDEYSWECSYAGGGWYETTECSGLLPGMPVSDDEVLGGHGPVVYRWDLERFLAGLDVFD